MFRLYGGSVEKVYDLRPIAFLSPPPSRLSVGVQSHFYLLAFQQGFQILHLFSGHTINKCENINDSVYFILNLCQYCEVWQLEKKYSGSIFTARASNLEVHCDDRSYNLSSNTTDRSTKEEQVHLVYHCVCHLRTTD